jgi:parvulin-like peptidyl-prolyl isomerase
MDGMDGTDDEAIRQALFGKKPGQTSGVKSRG